MEKTNPPKSIIGKVFSVFKSKRFRHFFYLTLIVFASFSMLCIDKDNAIRKEHFSFLNDNFIADLITWLGIARYDVTSKAWVLFIILITVATIAVIGNIIAPKFVDKKVKENAQLFSTERKTRIWYTTLFYGVLVLISAAILGVAALLGAFDLYGANVGDTSPFISLLTMLAFFLAFVLALFIAIIIIIFILRFIVLACAGKLRKSAIEQKTVKEEPVVATAEPVKEEPAAEPVAEKKETPVIINDIQETSATVATAATKDAPATRKSVQKSFKGKMSQATKEQKAYYNELKNYLLSFKRVNSRVSWNFDSFNIGRQKAVKIAFRGQTLVAFFALNPKDYKGTKYYPRDMSSKRRFADTPMMVKVKSQRGVKFAKELINEVCAGLDPKKNFVEEKYSFPYMSNKKLVENGLAKETTVTVFAPKK